MNKRWIYVCVLLCCLVALSYYNKFLQNRYLSLVIFFGGLSFLIYVADVLGVKTPLSSLVRGRMSRKLLLKLNLVSGIPGIIVGTLAMFVWRLPASKAVIIFFLPLVIGQTFFLSVVDFGSCNKLRYKDWINLLLLGFGIAFCLLFVQLGIWM